MRWTTTCSALALLGAAGLLAFALSCAGTQTPRKETATDPRSRGELIAVVSGCHDCHTPGGLYGQPDSTRRLAGSDLGWQGPWGVSYARNLTPDLETGIGKWTEDDIVKALRTGQRPDGSPLLPPMPWPNYTRASEEDLRALAVYLKSLPPVKHQVPAVVPPGKPATGALIPIPNPPAWDGQNMAPPGGAGGGPPTH